MMRLPNVLWGYIIWIAVILVIAVLVPAFWAVRTIAQRVVCGTQVKALSTALIVYADTHEGRYPTAEQWCDLILQDPGEIIEDAFRCPVDPKGTFSYAINQNLYTLQPGQGDPKKFVILFESDLGRNGVGGLEDLVLRHKDKGQLGCNIAFADGHVEFVTEDRIGDLQWTAE